MHAKRHRNVLAAVQAYAVDVLAHVVERVSRKRDFAIRGVVRNADLQLDLARFQTHGLRRVGYGQYPTIDLPSFGRLDPENQVVDFVVPMSLDRGVG